jgi:hypothetical protein
MNPLAHQVSCSVVLAAALTEFFPAAKLLSFQATPSCFFCDLVLPFPFEKEVFPLLEERMRVWIKKNISFEFLEMTPSNAANFLGHHGFPTVAAHVQHQENFVQIVRLDQFAGQASGRPLKTTGEIKFFKLCQAEKLGSVVRIIGASGHSKEELKEGVNGCKQIVNHLAVAGQLGLFRDGLWLPRGEALKNVLISRLVKLSGADVISSPALDMAGLAPFHAKYCQESGRGAFECVKQHLGGLGEGLLDPVIGTSDRLSLPLKEESVISFLQIIAKFFTIAPFNPRVVVFGKPSRRVLGALAAQDVKCVLERGSKPGIEFCLRDSLGREWTGPRIWEEEKIVSLSLFHSLERFVALLLEQGVNIETIG